MHPSLCSAIIFFLQLYIHPLSFHLVVIILFLSLFPRLCVEPCAVYLFSFSLCNFSERGNGRQRGTWRI